MQEVKDRMLGFMKEQEFPPITRLHQPFTKEARTQSCLRAKEFFKDRFPQRDKVPFYCRSWLLFKKHKEMLKPSSNIASFFNEFTVIQDYK